MNPEKYVSLVYLNDKLSFSTDTMFTGKWDPDWYCLIRQMPTAEMFGRDIVELAEELIQLTVSADWRRQNRRPVMCGDIICKGLDPWMYVRLEDLDDQTHKFSLVRLTAWPNYGLISLPRKSVESIICKQ